MACRGGCKGLDACTGGLFCCIGFEQDCGEGCTGLQNGQSRIQFDNQGRLVVCSNVGGVCECNPICPCPTFECRSVDANLAHIIDDTTGPGPNFLAGVGLGFTMVQAGIVDIHFSHHIRMVTDIAGRFNVIPHYQIDGGVITPFGPVHAIQNKQQGEEQHMTAMSCETLAAGVHTINIHYTLTDINLLPGETVIWNQTEIKINWLEY